MLIIPSTKPISDDFPFPRKSPGFLLQQTHSSYWSLFPNEVTAQENRDATRTLFSMTVNVLRAPPCSGLLEPKRNVNSLLFPLLPLEIVVFLFLVIVVEIFSKWAPKSSSRRGRSRSRIRKSPKQRNSPCGNPSGLLRWLLFSSSSGVSVMDSLIR